MDKLKDEWVMEVDDDIGDNDKIAEVEHTEGHKIGPSVEWELQERRKSENSQLGEGSQALLEKWGKIPMSEGAKALFEKLGKSENSQPMSERAKALLGKWAKQRR